MSTPDRIFLAYGGTDPLGVVTLGDLIPPAGAYEDTLKFSRCGNGQITVGQVHGGLEDCVDVNNHCQALTIHAELWVPHGQYVSTIKGGSKGITLSGKVRGHGSVTDVDLGNFSDQSDDITGPVFLSLEHELGPNEPIYVRRLNAMDPILVNQSSQRYVVSRPFPVWGAARSLWAKGFSVLKKLGWA